NGRFKALRRYLRPDAETATVRNMAQIFARDVQQWLRGLCDVDTPSVDRFLVGDPDTRVREIATCWMPYFDTLRSAVEQGVNVVVAHEPAFYAHWDLDDAQRDWHVAPEAARERFWKAATEKKAWCKRHDLVVIRSHDVPDRMSPGGMAECFAKQLGFDEDRLVHSEDYFRVYGVDAQPAGAVASSIATHLRDVGQPGVGFYGDASRRVNSVGVGTGCYCDPLQLMHTPADLFIVVDDVLRCWTHGTFAADTGTPMVVVNHGSSEEAGMRHLATLLAEQFSPTPVVHLPTGCSYRWVLPEF
ncbi:MAG: Nif3-like dinuclear metal center hexameric protein, partial [Planctomycetota bacterium]